MIRIIYFVFVIVINMQNLSWLPFPPPWIWCKCCWMTALYHCASSSFRSPVFSFLKRHTHAPFLLPPLFLSPVLSFSPLKRSFSLLIRAAMRGWINSLHFCFLLDWFRFFCNVDFMLPWLKDTTIYVSQLYHGRCAAVNSLAAVALTQKQACTHCSATDLPALAMLGLTLKDAVLQKGSLPAL